MPSLGGSIPVAAAESGCFAVVEPVEAELLCIPPGEIGEVAAYVAELEGGLAVCGAELEGCRREIEIRKTPLSTKLMRWTLLLGGGAIVGYAVAD